MIDALKRASAATINVVMPYFGYARQDRTAKPREPITAKLVANLIQKAGATRVLTLDLHTVQLQGFFDIPVDNLFTLPLLAEHYRHLGLCEEEVVIVSPKNSGVGRAWVLSEYLNATLAIIDHHIDESGNEKGYVIGNIIGKTCIMIDDMINTGETLAKGANVLMTEGAKDVYACASHGLFSANATELLNAAPIKKICVTDSIDLSNKATPEVVDIITCADLMGDGIKRIHENIPMSPLFKF